MVSPNSSRDVPALVSMPEQSAYHGRSSVSENKLDSSTTQQSSSARHTNREVSQSPSEGCLKTVLSSHVSPTCSSGTSALAGTTQSRVSLSSGSMLLEVNHLESSSTLVVATSSGVASDSSGVETTSISTCKSSNGASSLTKSSASTLVTTSPSKHDVHPASSFSTLGLPPSLSALYPPPAVGSHAFAASLPFMATNSLTNVSISEAGSLYPGILGGANSGAGLYAAAAAAAHAYKSNLPVTTSSHHSSVGSNSPYVAYARVKSSAGASTLVPICRDPFCNNCNMTLQNASSTTPVSSASAVAPSVSVSSSRTDCTDCTYSKGITPCPNLPSATVPVLPALPSATGALGLHGSLGGLSSLYCANQAAALAAAAAANPAVNPLSGLYGGCGTNSLFGSSSVPSGLPVVCNWMSGGEYCGKRFSTSEELFQHLRTHTTPPSGIPTTIPTGTVPTAATAEFFNPYTANLALAGLAAHGGLPPHYGATGTSLSPNSLSKSYSAAVAAAASASSPGRSLSPTSSLLTNRFHPYKHHIAAAAAAAASAAVSPLSGLPTPPSANGLPTVPSLAAYYPYSLYAQRLGAVAP